MSAMRIGSATLQFARGAPAAGTGVRWSIAAAIGAVLVVCAWQPGPLRLLFDGVAPDGAFAGVLGLAVLLAWFVVPEAVSVLVRRGVRPSLAALEAVLWGVLIVPAAMAGWKSAPHAAEALAPALLLVAAVWIVGVALGVVESRWPGRRRLRIAAASVLLALPAVGFVLAEFAERQPWWLMVGNPIWLIADAAPPRPNLASHVFFEATLLLWVSLAAGTTALAITRGRPVPAGAADRPAGEGAPGEAGPRRRATRLAAKGGLAVLAVAGLIATGASLFGTRPLGFGEWFAAPSDSPGGMPAAAVPFVRDDAAGDAPAGPLALEARWRFGDFGGDGFELPLALSLSHELRATVRDATAVAQAGTMRVSAPLPPLPSGAATQLDIGVVVPPGVRTVRVGVRTADGAWLGVAELTAPAYAVAQGALRGDVDRRAPRYFAGLAVAERAELRGGFVGYRDGRTAAVPLPGADLPRTAASWQPLTALVLASAARDDVDAEQLAALGRWVRAGGVLVHLGIPRSETLWTAALADLALPAPPDSAAEVGAARVGPWTRDSRDVTIGESGRVTVHSWSASRGAGRVVRLLMPAQAGARPADVLRGWLHATVGAPVDPLRAYEHETGSRLLAGDLAATAFRGGPSRDVPLGAFGHAAFAWVLAISLVLGGLALYRPPLAVDAAVLAGVALALTAALAVFVPTRYVEVVSLPVWVTRGAADDAGPAYEVRYVHVTRRKDGPRPVALATTVGERELLPAGGSVDALGRLPAERRTTASGAGTEARATLELEPLRSHEFRLARVAGLTDDPVGVRLASSARGDRLEIDDGRSLRALMLVDDFRIVPLAARADSGRVAVPDDAGDASGRPYREVLSALVRDEAFASGPTGLTLRERLALRSLVSGAVGRDRRFLVAVVDHVPAAWLAADGPTTHLRPILFIPVPRPGDLD